MANLDFIPTREGRHRVQERGGSAKGLLNIWGGAYVFQSWYAPCSFTSSQLRQIADFIDELNSKEGKNG